MFETLKVHDLKVENRTFLNEQVKGHSANKFTEFTGVYFCFASYGENVFWAAFDI